jgi:hypothetical protein
MQRRGIIGLAAGTIAAPALERAALRSELVAARLPLEETFESEFTYPKPSIGTANNNLTQAAYALLMREKRERDMRKSARHRAWAKPFDPDIAALASCSEIYLRHLQEQRILIELQESEEMDWRLWGKPQWMQD